MKTHGTGGTAGSGVPGDSEDFVSCTLSLRLKLCLKVAEWD